MDDTDFDIDADTDYETRPSGPEATFEELFRDYYDAAVKELAQNYPKDQRSLTVDYQDLYRKDHALADDLRAQPREVLRHAEAALAEYDLPIDVSLEGAHVRIENLPSDDTFYPGGFSPDRRMDGGKYLAIRGIVEKSTDVYLDLQEGHFECQRCGRTTQVPQPTGDYRDPHECRGCERQGPFQLDFDASEFVDAQLLRIKEPPERARGGEGQTIDVYVEDDLAETVDAGDRVTIAGVLQLEQQGGQQDKEGRFEPYLEGEAVTVEDSDYEDFEITADEREHFEDISADIFDLAVDSIALGIKDEREIKESLLLMLVGGARVDLPDGGAIRGDIHILMIGDPSTGKSTLLDAVADLSPRSVQTSGKGATKAGMTASAVRDDFGQSEWALEAGALVEADKGVAAVDEIDKVPDEVVSSMHRALSRQDIKVNKAGINATLPTRTAMLAAGNPKYSRWDDYGDISEQIDLDGTLLSRFGLIFRLVDTPDEERDRKLGQHIVGTKEAAKREAQDGPSYDADPDIEPAIPHETLRKYIAYAKRQPAPTFRDPSEYSDIVDSYVTFRGMNDYDEDAAVPISPRKLEDIHRLAEASARARLSEYIEEADIRRAQRLVGESLRQYGQNEDGEYDVDTIEAGQSKTQSDRIKSIKSIVREHHDEYDEGLPYEEFYDLVEQHGIDRSKAEREVQQLKNKAELYEPRKDQTLKPL